MNSVNNNYFRFLFLSYFGICSLTCSKHEFIENHWKHPIEEQVSLLQQSKTDVSLLTPETCGSCHVEQYSLWKTSLHSQSVESGLLWQLPGLGEKKSDACLNCHSPLKETRILLKSKERWIESYPSYMNAYFPSNTKDLGLSCASCHVRKHIYYGPPILNNRNHGNRNSHNGFVVKSEFESSNFCKSCHESNSKSDLLNGKRMMETFTEWESSQFKRSGIQCQGCHMPGRNHSWKGIHDRDMVLSGIEKKISFRDLGPEIEISAELISTNIGHKFPTYSVPQIYLNLYLMDKERLKVKIGDYTIGRLVDINLKREFYDTRLEPGKNVILTYKILKTELKRFKTVVFEAVVQPDELYERMFSVTLENKESLGHTLEVTNQINESLNTKRNSKYKLFILNVPVPDQFPE